MTAHRMCIGTAAFPALRGATGICAAQPGSVVLVACTELCSLHIRSSRAREQIDASAVFGDGASAMAAVRAAAATPLARFAAHAYGLGLDRSVS